MDRDVVLERARAPFAVGDPLRGIAALAVAVSHVLGVAMLTWIVATRPEQPVSMTEAFGVPGSIVNAGGTLGVSVFFVLSGYLLSRPFVRAFVLDDDRPELVRFARNRIVRVVPAYWAVLTILVVGVVLTGLEDAGAGGLVRLYLFDGGLSRSLVLWIGQAWTLDVEMRFYLALALVGTAIVMLGGALGPRLGRRERFGLLALVVAGVTLWSFQAHPARGAFVAVAFGENAGRFMGGIALAILEATSVRWLASRSAARAAFPIFAVGLVALMPASLAHQDPGLPLSGATPWALSLAASAVVAGPLLWQWAGRAPWRGLDNRVLRWAGSRSYSIYLVHFPLYVGLMRAASGAGYRERAALLAVVGLPLTLVASELLHRWVERPFLRRRAPSQVAPTP